ncbi:MAG: hypothetical protein AABZ55_13485 [Bdellovibrionota bacterium]
MILNGGIKFKTRGQICTLISAIFLLALARDSQPPGSEIRYTSIAISRDVGLDSQNIAAGNRVYFFPKQCDSQTGGGCRAIDPMTNANLVITPDEVTKTPTAEIEPPPILPGKTGEKDACIEIPIANAPSNESVPSSINPPLSTPTERTPAGMDKPAGSPQTGTSSNPISTLAYSSLAADSARGLDLVSAARARNEAVYQAAKQDVASLSSRYVNLPPKLLQESFESAQGFLDQVVDHLSEGKSKLDPSEAARFKNLYLNARDKAALAAASLSEQAQSQNGFGAGSPFGGLINPGLGPDQNPLSKTPGLADIFGTDPLTKAPTSTDSLVNRMLMLGGLTDQQRKKALKDLKLAESIPFKLRDGQITEIPILHNGYLLGGGKSAIDCSSFVSQILPADIRKGNLTTLDLRNIWIFKKKGKVPNPPTYDKGRLELIKTMSDGFVAIDLYNGDQLAVGDLLVYRLPWDPIGHVFLVKGFNPTTQRAEVIEAAQSAGTIRERDFSLTREQNTAGGRAIRPGLLALRLNPVSNRCCGYKETRQPATKILRPPFKNPGEESK